MENWLFGLPKTLPSFLVFFTVCGCVCGLSCLLSLGCLVGLSFEEPCKPSNYSTSWDSNEGLQYSSKLSPTKHPRNNKQDSSQTQPQTVKKARKEGKSLGGQKANFQYFFQVFTREYTKYEMQSILSDFLSNNNIQRLTSHLKRLATTLKGKATCGNFSKAEK